MGDCSLVDSYLKVVFAAKWILSAGLTNGGTVAVRSLYSWLTFFQVYKYVWLNKKQFFFFLGWSYLISVVDDGVMQ